MFLPFLFLACEFGKERFWCGVRWLRMRLQSKLSIVVEKERVDFINCSFPSTQEKNGKNICFSYAKFKIIVCSIVSHNKWMASSPRMWSQNMLLQTMYFQPKNLLLFHENYKRPSLHIAKNCTKMASWIHLLWRLRFSIKFEYGKSLLNIGKHE